MKKQIATGILFCLVCVLTACGYQFTGSGKFPAGVSRIFITMLENRSSEPGIESTFTGDLIYEFTRNRKSAIADDRESADAVLSGTLSRITTDTISRSSISTALERRATATLNLRLISLDGQVIWSSGDIVEDETYLVVQDNKAATNENKRKALLQISKKMAESAFSRMTDDF
ncbi:LPS assembly lipoprotein LptE [Desulfosarcina sp. OttesenSCG-928-A07]|nr:LPS assembly lipoprotein LptE [Desulfosarcina sp. OttesenSCG-928-G17]MDL2330122.1 LPS assembly lipoprotein LptE [Desulfosarcina sp. OttesenSCG-928-A07]